MPQASRAAVGFGARAGRAAVPCMTAPPPSSDTAALAPATGDPGMVLYYSFWASLCMLYRSRFSRPL